MAKMLGEFKVSHLQVITPDTLARLKEPGATTGLVLCEINNQVVIRHLLENSAAAKAGLKAGFVVTKISGEAMEILVISKNGL